MKLGIIGHFGGTKNLTDGQTVKTKTFYESLMKEENISIYKADTYFLRKNPIKFIWQFLNCVIRNKKIIFLLSDNGRKYLFPLFYFFSKYFNKKFYNCAIGSRLFEEVNKYKNFKKYVLSFEDNWLENKKLILQLKEIGIENTKFVPNFKNIKILEEKELKNQFDAPFNFCIFSRITLKKGIFDAINAINEINSQNDSIKCTLDLYGPIDEEIKEEFFSKINNDTIKYKGIIEPNNSVEILKEYFCLLFPTQYYHEGIPGTIIDALSSGVPVISRNWEFCKEMIENNYNGLIYDFENSEKLVDCIKFAIENKEKMIKLRPNCLKSAEKYSRENIVKDILTELEQ